MLIQLLLGAQGEEKLRKTVPHMNLSCVGKGRARLCDTSDLQPGTVAYSRVFSLFQQLLRLLYEHGNNKNLNILCDPLSHLNHHFLYHYLCHLKKRRMSAPYKNTQNPHRCQVVP